MIRAVLALAGVGAGQVLQLLAQATPSVSSSELSSWVSAGGTSIAVAGLAYIARLLASGHLVAYPVERLQEEAAERERQLGELVRRAHDRESTLDRIISRRLGIEDTDA